MKSRLTVPVAAFVAAFGLAASLPPVLAHEVAEGDTSGALHAYKLKYCVKIDSVPAVIDPRSDWYKTSFWYNGDSPNTRDGYWPHKWGSDGTIHYSYNEYAQGGGWKCASGGTGTYHTHNVAAGHHGHWRNGVIYVDHAKNKLGATFDIGGAVDDQDAHTVCIAGTFECRNSCWWGGVWKSELSFNCVAE